MHNALLEEVVKNQDNGTENLNIDFIRNTTQAVLGSDCAANWRLANADNVRFLEADPLYQLLGSDFRPAVDAEDAWCKLVFSNGKTSRYAYFGIAFERIPDLELQGFASNLLAGPDSAQWLRQLCHDLPMKLADRWDPYRPIGDDPAPRIGPLTGFEDPVGELRRTCEGFYLVTEIELEANPGVNQEKVRSAVRETLRCILPIWRGIVQFHTSRRARPS